jgi:PAS domain S-box-containing protein
MLSLTKNELSQKIFEFSNDGTFVLSLDDNSIIEVNPAATKMLVFSREELLSMSISDIHPREMDLLEEFANRVLVKGAGWTNELTFKTKSKSYFLLKFLLR